MLNRLGPENTVSKQGRGERGDLLKVAGKDWFKNIFVIVTLLGLPARAGPATHPNHGSSGRCLFSPAPPLLPISQGSWAPRPHVGALSVSMLILIPR